MCDAAVTKVRFDRVQFVWQAEWDGCSAHFTIVHGELWNKIRGWALHSWDCWAQSCFCSLIDWYKTQLRYLCHWRWRCTVFVSKTRSVKLSCKPLGRNGRRLVALQTLRKKSQGMWQKLIHPQQIRHYSCFSVTMYWKLFWSESVSSFLTSHQRYTVPFKLIVGEENKWLTLHTITRIRL